VVGTVERGDGRGRAIGMPTANCGARENQEPAPGVYAGIAELDNRRWPAAINVGRNPTIAPDRPLTVEAHLVGYSGECYGSRLALDLVARLRDERRFPSLDALKEQIAADVREAARFVAS
jgi:riboflavin kinase/FMN adenylyltransferase